MRVVSLFPLVFGLAHALAGPRSHVRHLHERRTTQPPGWTLHDVTPPPELRIPGGLRIALSQSNLDRAHDELMRVSDPTSPNFAAHWSAKEIAEFFAPSRDAVDSVMAWLQSEGIDPSRVKQSISLGWLDIKDATIEEAERLLDTTYYLYSHDTTDTPHLACHEYSLPAQVQPHIDFVLPTVNFDRKLNTAPTRLRTPTPSSIDARAVEPDIAKSVGMPWSSSGPKLGGKLSKIWNELANCSNQIVPICLQALYHIPFDKQRATEKNSYGIVEYAPQSYFPSDLQMFFEMFVPKAVGTTPVMDSIDGGFLNLTLGDINYYAESSLDLEYAMALVYPLVPTLYQTGDDEMGASFNNFLDAIDGSYCTYEGGDDPTQDGVYPDPLPGGYKGPENCGGFAAAKVISTSYDYNEVDLTPFYETRQCNEYLKLGLQGTTILYSSGDYGVASNADQCIDPASGNLTDTGSVFVPSFPGTCPYITSVGATQIKPNASVFEPEEACETVIYSGGGFSNVFPMPSYQKAAVKSYFKNYPPPYSGAIYNNSQMTRGLPDISANGAKYVVAINSTYYHVYGTSCSSPVVGSIISLINDARLAVGKKSVGFINPVLYSNPWVLNDIVSGNNPGCNTTGFSAVPGWDPVTGLGTPDYDKLVALYLSLP